MKFAPVGGNGLALARSARCRRRDRARPALLAEVAATVAGVVAGAGRAVGAGSHVDVKRCCDKTDGASSDKDNYTMHHVIDGYT